MRYYFPTLAQCSVLLKMEKTYFTYRQKSPVDALTQVPL